jgi:hypothetical protein
MSISIVEFQNVSRSLTSRGLLVGQNAFTLGSDALKQAADYLGDAAAKVSTPVEVVVVDVLDETAEAAEAAEAVPEDEAQLPS